MLDLVVGKYALGNSRIKVSVKTSIIVMRYDRQY